MRVGFIGLGNQGGPMAARIGYAGFDLTVYTRRPATLEAFDAEFAKVPYKIAESPAALARAVDVLCVCPRTDDDLLALCRGHDGVLAHLRTGAVLTMHATVHPRTVIALAGEAAALGIDALDTPVSGGHPVAAKGELMTIVGGSAATLERVRPVLAAHSDKIVRVGEVGAGQLAKLVNNALFGAHLGTTLSALRAGVRLGLDEGALVQVLMGGSGSSFAGNSVGAMPDRAKGSEQLYSLMGKDLDIFASLTEGDESADALLAMARRFYGGW